MLESNTRTIECEEHDRMDFNSKQRFHLFPELAVEVSLVVIAEQLGVVAENRYSRRSAGYLLQSRRLAQLGDGTDRTVPCVSAGHFAHGTVAYSRVRCYNENVREPSPSQSGETVPSYCSDQNSESHTRAQCPKTLVFVVTPIPRILMTRYQRLRS